MIIARRRFRKTCNGAWISGALWLCGGRLYKVFDVPTDVSTIWITLRNRQTAFSYRLQLMYWYGFFRAIDDTERLHLEYSAESYLRRLYERGIKTIHVEVEYEE